MDIFNPDPKSLMEMYFALMIYSALIQSLPTPAELGGNVWYRAFYNFFSVLGTDFKSFVKPPGQAQVQLTATSSNTTVQPSGAVESTKSTITESK